MTRQFAYWQHPLDRLGIRLCPIEHRWRWTSRLHWRWWLVRDRVGDAVMILGARIGGQWEPER